MSVTASLRTVLITGSAKRLGREFALNLAKAGWQVAVHYRSSDQEARQTVSDCANFGASSAAFAADLAQEGDVRQLLGNVISHFGQVDAVVNSASLFEHDDAGTFSFANLDRHLHSNTGAAILLAQALHAHVVQRKAKGVVVNLLDQKLWNPNPDFLSYTLSKAALEAANTLLAMALAPQVRVVGVAPGLTLGSHMMTQEKFESLHKLAALGRSSTPQDVALAVKFALENSSITGTTLIVDGGQHLQRQERDFSMMQN